MTRDWKTHYCILALGIVLAVTSGTARAGLIIDDREWYQPAELTGYSWLDLVATCGSGPCNGTLDGTGPDLTGWNWATVYEVGSLFAALTPHPGGIAYYADRTPEDDGPAWARYFVSNSGSSGFIWTFESLVFPDYQRGVAGLTATRAGSTGNPYLGIGGIQGYPSPTRPFEIETDGLVITAESSRGVSYRSPELGAWVYRDLPSDIPEPSTFLLVLGALAAACSRRCRASAPPHPAAAPESVRAT